MPLNRSEKADVVAQVGALFDANDVIVVMQNKGLTVAEISVLRDQMRAAGCGVRVVKNRLVKLGLKDRPGEKIATLFTGPTLLAWSEDPVTAPKILTKYAKTNDRIEIVGGIMEETPLDAAGVEALSKMPSREEVLSEIAGMLTVAGGNIVAAATAPAANIAAILSTLEEREDA